MPANSVLSVALLRYTLRQRTFPAFIGQCAAMFGSGGGYLMPINPPASVSLTDYQP